MSDETNTGQNDTGGIAQLRKQVEEQAKQLTALSEENAGLRAEKRTTDVASTLKAKGLDEKRAASLAKFYSGEDASAESVGKWLDENADAFGVTQGSQQTPPAANAPSGDPNVAAAQAVQQAAFGTTTPTNPPAGAPIVVGDPAELQRLYEGGASVEQLQAMGLFPKNLNPTRGALDDWK